MPPFTIQPLCLLCLSCSLPGTHHSSFPPQPSSSCHLIQITELASVSFVWGSILPGRWTGGEEMDSHWGEYACVCSWDGRTERKGGGGWNFSGRQNVKQQWSEETFICQTCVRSCLSGYWVTRLQLKRAEMRKWGRQNEFTSHSVSLSYRISFICICPILP